MKKPRDCKDMAEIREAIDALDHEVVQLFGQRFAYVQAAAKFKTDEQSVRAPQRFESMLQQRRLWAEQNGLNADAIEKLFRDLVTHFIKAETEMWRENKVVSSDETSWNDNA